MSKRVYHLKRSTHREQYRHMKNVMEWQSDLRKLQDAYSPETAAYCMICGNPVESHPMIPGTCYECYRTLAPAQTSDALQFYLCAHWDKIPEVEF